MARISVAALVLSACIFSGVSASAQSTATLQGSITDTQGGVMPGVTVTIRNTATGVERSLVTGSTGEYVGASLPPGHYRVVTHVDGFTDQTREIDLGVAQTAVLNVKLSVGTLAENVTVTGASPFIETATVSVGQVMAERTVQEIPLNGRHFVDLGPLMPGGSTSPQNAGLSAPLRGQGAFSFMSAGNRETSVNMMVNGINLNDLSNSQVTFQPSINTVSEFKVDNSTFSAEYGRNSGAIVNVATRSGSNQLHGEAFDFYRDDRFDSRNYFNPASLDTVGNETPQSLFNRKQFGFNLGGPVARNRSFFFGSYEGLRHKQGVDLNSGTLTNAQRAAVTDPVARNLLAYIPVANDLTGTRAIGSPPPPPLPRLAARARHHRPVHDRFTQQPPAERRPAFLLRVPEGLPARIERAGADRRRLPGPARRPPAGDDDQRNAYRQPGAGQRSAGRLQPHQHRLHSADAGRHHGAGHQRRPDRDADCAA